VPDGYKYKFTVTDEIVRLQTGMPDKLLCLQLIEFEDRKKEVRLGYYIIGKKPKMRGKWVWGQYCTLLPLADFRALVQSAERKGWL
jgi:hypothetical protein